jgi:hypothetical protein
VPGISVMTDDIFGKNALTESNGIVLGGRGGAMRDSRTDYQ